MADIIVVECRARSKKRQFGIFADPLIGCGQRLYLRQELAAADEGVVYLGR
jgi:hypothetical protein